MENNNYFNAEIFLEMAFESTKKYKYSYENCLYLRFCFLLFYFEIDICSLCEEKYPHTYQDEDYNYEVGLTETKKHFFYDVTRSNKGKISHALSPYIDIFKEELISKEFYGLFPEVRQYMRKLLIETKNIETILSNYENFISFFSNMTSYLDDNFYTNYYEPENDKSLFYCCYSDDKEFYIDVLENNYTKKILYDIARYPAYIGLSTDMIVETITIDINYWNFIFENWDIFLLIYEENHLFNSFKVNLEIIKKEIIYKKIDNLFDGNNYSRTDLILDNAEKYARFLSFYFNPPRRSKSAVLKLCNKKLKTYNDKACFLFCEENRLFLKKLNESNIRLLFRMACLGNLTLNEVPRIDLNELITNLYTKC